jgi:serine protease AprX
MQNSLDLSEKLDDAQGIAYETVHNVSATIERFGGKLLRDYYEGCYSLLAALPAESIVKIVENPFVKKLYLNGPIVPEGFDNTVHLYSLSRTRDNINLYSFGIAALWFLIVPCAIVTLKKKAKKKMLAFLAVAIVLSLTFFTNIPSIKALNISTSVIRANDVWATGNRGGGVNVAVIDTGFDINHNDLAPAIVHRINAHDWSNNVGGNEEHGTHVAGIVAGRGINNNVYRGVAWEAGLVLVKVEADADFEPAIRWVINNRAQFNIRAITMSLRLVNVPPGGDGLESPASIAMDDAVENGIVTVKSAGNIGHQGSRTITSPGNAFNIITVGAINDMDTPNISDDEFAYYPNGYTYKGRSYPAWGSSRGPTGDGRPKPDIVAPGVHIWSCRSAGSAANFYEDVTADGFYGELSGTSMAAPHVAGTVALMLHANPNLTPAQVKAILRQTARLNTNLNGWTVNDRGHGIIDAYDAVQLAQNVNNINIGQMYDSWSGSTPSRDLGWWCYDYLTFHVQRPSTTFGISLTSIDYHYRHPLGWGNTDYRLIWQLSARHVWIDGTYYDLGTNMHRYLFSGPRIYERGGGYIRMRAWSQIGNVRIMHYWYAHVDTIWLWLQYSSGSSWKTLIYIDPEVWDTTNYPYLPSTSETVLIERKVTGDVLLNVRDLGHTEYIQLDPYAADNPVMWVLRHGYFGNNPDALTALNKEYVYNRDIAIYYQGTSSYPGGWIYRRTDALPAPNPTQNDAGTGGDAGNTFNAATFISSGSYTGILCNSEADNGNDYYKFYAEIGQSIYVSMTPPAGIDFDLQLYNPAGTLKAGSYLGAGYTDSISYTADSTGYWRARIYIYSGEAQYSFYVSVYWPGGGGCPILYIYDGKKYVCEGMLDIHNPEGIDVVTNHTLITTPKRVKDAYQLRLVEHPQTHSYIDHVRLFAVLPDKTMIELPLISAIHSEYGDVLPQLLSSDEWKTETLGANWNNGTSQSIDLKFQALPPNMKILGFLFAIEGNNVVVKV